MQDDDVMDRMLRAAMQGEVPALSRDFDARVLGRVRPRRLSRIGRAIVSAYVVGASVSTVWLQRDLPWTIIATAAVVTVTVAAASAAYGRRLTADS